MSSNNFLIRNLTLANNENPVKNIKNSLATGRKKTALKVLTNTVQSSKKSDGKDLKVPKVLPMPEFETEINCKSTSHDKFHKETEEFDHFGCLALKEKDFLPSSMTCNLDLLSDFFSSKDDESDWFLEDYNNIMIDTIKNTFDNFEKPITKPSLSVLPLMDFPEIVFV